MKNLPAVVLFTFITLALFGCPKDPDGDGLENTYWQLTEIKMNEEPLVLPETVMITLTFEDNKLSGKGVCNRYFAEYTVEGKNMSVGVVASTKMGCGEYANLETNYFTVLGDTKTFGIKKKNLIIESERGTLKYMKTEAPEPEKK